MPLLGTLPPLHGAMEVRYVDIASNKGANTHQDLVPIEVYYEEEYPYNDYPTEPMRDEYQQFMMIGQRINNYGCGKPMGRGQGNVAPILGPCFKCGGDH